MVLNNLHGISVPSDCNFTLPTLYFLLHTGLAMGIAIGAVWTNRILPIDAG